MLKKNVLIFVLLSTLNIIKSEKFFSFPHPFPQEEISDSDYSSVLDTNECLPSKEEAIKILKRDYNITNITDPDENQRFILGKCNPILIIPGIYGTKLVGSFECKKMAENDRETLKNIRVFCGDSVCKDESIEHEEHSLFISALDPATSLLGGEGNKYSACLGFLMTFLNHKNDCPVLEETNENICRYSPYYKITYYGGSENTKNESKCGLGSVELLVQATYKPWNTYINQAAAKGFHEMIQKLHASGYREGFSFAGSPYDYREFLATNKFAEDSFRYNIERLYNQTGKPIIIAAHSYGNLMTLNLLNQEKNKDLIPKIKKFICIAPPFAGSTKLLNIFLKGMHEWDASFKVYGKEVRVTNYNLFGQNIVYHVMPTIMELRPLNIINKLFTSEFYKDFGEAINERLDLEKECYDKDCDNEYIKEHSKKFNEVFGEDVNYPDLKENECKYSNIPEEKYFDNEVLAHPCRTEIYNLGKCPALLLTTDYFKPKLSDINNYCGVYNDSTYYDIECNNDINCVDKIYYTKGPYAFDEKKKVKYLINRYNRLYKKQFDNKDIDENFFENKKVYREKTKKQIEYYNNISLTKDLTIPPVDTDIIYGNFHNTATAFLYNESNKGLFNDKEDVLFKGGDDTVPNWSSMLVGMKWIYDKKKMNLTQKIKLVEFCSKLGKNGKYAFDENKVDEEGFVGLSCDCIDDNNIYKSSMGKCTHAACVSDNYIIDYLKANANNKKEEIKYSDAKKEAFIKYNPGKDYLNECNNELKNIFDLDS